MNKKISLIALSILVTGACAAAPAPPPPARPVVATPPTTIPLEDTSAVLGNPSNTDQSAPTESFQPQQLENPSGGATLPGQGDNNALFDQQMNTLPDLFNNYNNNLQQTPPENSPKELEEQYRTFQEDHATPSWQQQELPLQQRNIPTNNLQQEKIPMNRLQEGTIPSNSLQEGKIPSNSLQEGKIPMNSLQEKPLEENKLEEKPVD